MLLKIKEKLGQLLAFIWNEKAPLSRRWPILFWFGASFCFFIFPLFLLDVGLDSYLETRKTAQKRQIFNQLNRKLELLLQYGNSRHYYHSLLSRVYELAQQSSDPFAYLKKALPHLKKRNPHVFRFIVWDKNGKTVNGLTDEKRYKYIIRTLYEVFVKATRECLENYPGNPQSIPLVDKRINLLRSYLGAFFIPERLNLPFLRGILGECIMASSAPEKSHFWYQINDEFGFFANISIDAMESNDYLNKLVASLNKDQSSKIVVGIAELIKDDKLVTQGDFRFRSEILIELGKFLNTRETEVETSQQLLVIKPVTPFVLGFCSVPTRGLIVDTLTARKRILLIAALLLAFVGVVLGYLIFKSSFFSIRWKLAILFAYANGLPLLILGFLGMEYLSQTRAQLLDKAQKQINDMISDIDYRFNDVLDRYAGKLNEKGAAVSKKFENNEDYKDKLAEFENLVDSFEPNDFILADQQGNFKIFKCAGRKSDKFIQNMAKKLLEYINQKKYTPRAVFEQDAVANDTKIKAQQLISGEGILFDELLQKVGVIDRQQMAAEERLYYWSFLGDYAIREFAYLVMISWPHEKLQERYLKEFLSDFNENEQQIKFYAMVETNGITHPDKKVPAAVEKLFRQIFNLKLVRTDSLLIAGEAYTAYGSVGRHMNRVALVGVYPMQIIAAYLQGIRLRLILFAFLSLCLTSGIGIMLARQFLEPVKELENGVKAIGAQNFRYRIPIKSEDEFGHLSTVFNQAIESLEDLEVAKVVQENLFPADPLAHGSLQVFGKSVSMTRLGGDYYDYYAIDDEYAGILMGDVAGHGVPAALLMAMAKASVLLAAVAEKHSPAALLRLLHSVIYTVKSSKIRRMMTCQYFCINAVTGAFKFSNAGHCFPAIIRDKGNYFELVKSIGTPLGISKRARYKDEDHQLQDGDIMILYTDGIIETKNEQGEEMGFDNFQRILCESYSQDLEDYYNNIFNAYLAWSPNAEDDITFVIFRFSSEKKLEVGKND